MVGTLTLLVLDIFKESLKGHVVKVNQETIFIINESNIQIIIILGQAKQYETMYCVRMVAESGG